MIGVTREGPNLITPGSQDETMVGLNIRNSIKIAKASSINRGSQCKTINFIYLKMSDSIKLIV